MGVARTFQTIRLFPNLTTWEHILIAQNFLTRAGNGHRFLPDRQLEKELKTEAQEILTLLDFMGRQTAQSGNASIRQSAQSGDCQGAGHPTQTIAAR